MQSLRRGLRGVGIEFVTFGLPNLVCSLGLWAGFGSNNIYENYLNKSI